MKPRLEKVKNEDVRSCYRVLLNGACIGYVWSEFGFSYRGSQGWNRGVRLQDFYPIEWECGTTPGGAGSYSVRNRGDGVRRLVEIAASLGT